jgi:hypothetical protein
VSLRPSPWRSRPLSKWFSGRWRAVTTAVRKSPGKILGAALGVVIVAAVTVGGLGFVQDQGQSETIDKFCTDLKAQNYADAYSLLSHQVSSQFASADQFQQFMKVVDKLQGNATSCKTKEAIRIPLVSPSSITGSRLLSIYRNAPQEGSIQMKHEDGQWQVDGLDASLLTVSLNAAAVAVGYCDVLKNLDFRSAYQMLSSHIRSSEHLLDYTKVQISDYVAHGDIQECQVTAINSSINETTANLSLTVIYANLGNPATGDICLSTENNRWVIGGINSGLLGTSGGQLQADYAQCTQGTASSTRTQPAKDLLANRYAAQ